MFQIIFIIVFLGIISCDQGQNQHDVYQCTSRFEFRELLWNKTYKCEDVSRHNPICGPNLHVAYSVHPPYVWSDKVKGAVGILPGMIEAALQTCCGRCFHVTYHEYSDDFEKFSAENASLVLPVQASTKSKYYFNHDYVHMIEVEGVTFFGPPRKHDPNKTTETIFKAVFSTWPLFVIALVMAVTAGICIWLLDSRWNQEEFPDAFLKGPFEGFWWAVVSMTTVGYGDRAPKSVIGRIFAIIWIIVGITLFSMYTAALTSSLTSSVISQHEINLPEMKIGILSTTAVGKSTMIQMNAPFKGYHDIHLIAEAFETNEIEVACLDDNIVYHFIEDLLERGIADLVKYEHKEVNGFSYGMLSMNENITRFFRSFYENNDDQRDILLKEALGVEHVPQLQTNAIDAGEIFSPKKMFVTCLISLIIIAIVLMLGSFFVKRIRKFTSNKDEDAVELKGYSQSDKDEEITQLVEELLKKLRERKC